MGEGGTCLREGRDLVIHDTNLDCQQYVEVQWLTSLRIVKLQVVAAQAQEGAQTHIQTIFTFLVNQIGR